MGLSNRPPVSETFATYRRDFRDRRRPGESVNQFDEREEIERFLVHLMRVAGCGRRCIQRNLAALRAMSFAQLVHWSTCVHHWTREQWEHVWREKAGPFAERYAPGRPEVARRWQTGEYVSAVQASARLGTEPCNVYPQVDYDGVLRQQQHLIESGGEVPTLDEWLAEVPPPPPPDDPTRGEPFRRWERSRWPGLDREPQPAGGPYLLPANQPPVLGDVEFATVEGGPFVVTAVAPADAVFVRALFTDADGDAALVYQMEVSLSPTFAVVTHWQTHPVTLAVPVAAGAYLGPVAYLGQPLPVDSTMFFRLRAWDGRGVVSDWSVGSLLVA